MTRALPGERTHATRTRVPKASAQATAAVRIRTRAMAKAKKLNVLKSIQLVPRASKGTAGMRRRRRRPTQPKYSLAQCQMKHKQDRGGEVKRDK